MTYDSRPETLEHIREVQRRIDVVVDDLTARALAHDQSKLGAPELAVFDEWTPKLKATTYPSPEYTAALEGMGEGLRHHYQANDHHPEHHPNGVQDMHLGQIIEMLADWKAATLRHKDGNLARSIHENAGRFGYGPELEGLLLRTAAAYGWLDA